jgi:outer membrane protein OmpA-like peptidoglycan-associated protein
MGDVYIPGVWSQRYKNLPPPARADVDQEVNKRFKERTGLSRTLDPKKDHDLANRWLRIRDEVMAQMAGKGSGDPRKTSRGMALGLPSPMKNFAYLLLYNYDINDHKSKPEHIKVLNGLVFPLMMNPGLDLHVGVIGNASRTGSDTDNQTLSERRAAEIDTYLRKLAKPNVFFFKAGGAGEKDQVSKTSQYRDLWPLLESLEEDERDRSVLVLIQWQPVGIIDALNQPTVDWNKAFDQAATRAGLAYALGAFFKVTADYAPSPKVKGVPSPWNPWTGWPNSWTMDRPDGWAVMDAIRPEIISDIEQAAKRKGLNISRDEIERRYEEWLKSPTNKWVPSTPHP